MSFVRPALRLVCAGLLGWCSLQPALAHVTEDQIDVPVDVANIYGKRVAQNIRVTVFSDDQNPVPAPVLVLNHGRAGDPVGRARLGRARFTAAADFFMQRGFIVAVPTRVGYGITGGEDVEDSGDCRSRNYEAAFAAAADQVQATLEAVRQRPDAAQDRAVIVGQSVGGGTTVAVAARNLPGVVAAINFAGGAGGDPVRHPAQPCVPAQLARTMSGYGKTAREPMLWLYADNDRFFGAEHPRAWFDGFIANGGKGEFVEFPPQGEDGHTTFARFPQTWHPPVSDFLARMGFPALRE